jgi:hypothetical protein
VGYIFVFKKKASNLIESNRNPYIEEEQTTQWPKEKDKQRSIKHAHKCANKIYVLLFIAHFH